MRALPCLRLSTLAGVLAAVPCSAQTTSLVSVAQDGTQGNDDSFGAWPTADGRVVSFESRASNLGYSGFDEGIFLRDTASGELDLAAWQEYVEVGMLSDDGATIVYTLEWDYLDYSYWVYLSQSWVRYVRTGQAVRLERRPDGNLTDGDVYHPSLSGDGRYAVFSSNATDMIVDQTLPGGQVYRRDLVADVVELVSVNDSGVPANWYTFQPSASADGRFVAFGSEADNLVPGSGNGKGQVFVRDLLLGKTERVSVSSAGEKADEDCNDPLISHCGRFVSFVSAATSLVPDDTNGVHDAFVHDRYTGVTELVSVRTGGAQFLEPSWGALVTRDGRHVVFSSQHDMLGIGPSFEWGTYVRDRLLGTTELVSRHTDGTPADASTWATGVSPDGRYVVMGSSSTALVDGDTNGKRDAFLRDRGELALGTTYCSPAVPNSTGLPARIEASGSPAVGDDLFAVTATELPPDEFGYFLMSATQGFVAGPGGSQGNLCLGGTIGRFSGLVQSSGPTGFLAIHVPITQLAGPLPPSVQPGETWNLQAWFRDHNPGSTSNFTDAVSVTFE